MQNFLCLIKDTKLKYFTIFLTMPILINAIAMLVFAPYMQSIIELISSLAFLYISINLFFLTEKSSLFFYIWVLYIYPICLLSTLFSINFHGNLSQSIINLILETNLNEASEILTREFSVLNFLVILAFIVCAIWPYQKYLSSHKTHSLNLPPKKKRIQKFTYLTFLLLYLFIPKYLSFKPLYAIKS